MASNATLKIGSLQIGANEQKEQEKYGVVISFDYQLYNSRAVYSVQQQSGPGRIEGGTFNITVVTKDTSLLTFLKDQPDGTTGSLLVGPEDKPIRKFDMEEGYVSNVSETWSAEMDLISQITLVTKKITVDPDGVEINITKQ